MWCCIRLSLSADTAEDIIWVREAIPSLWACASATCSKALTVSETQLSDFLAYCQEQGAAVGRSFCYPQIDCFVFAELPPGIQIPRELKNLGSVFGCVLTRGVLYRLWVILHLSYLFICKWETSCPKCHFGEKQYTVSWGQDCHSALPPTSPGSPFEVLPLCIWLLANKKWQPAAGQPAQQFCAPPQSHGSLSSDSSPKGDWIVTSPETLPPRLWSCLFRLHVYTAPDVSLPCLLSLTPTSARSCPCGPCQVPPTFSEIRAVNMIHPAM